MVKSIATNTYKMKYCSVKKLKKLGFKHDEELEKYTMTFPVYRNNKASLLFGTILCDEQGRISLNVTDKNGDIYPPFYRVRYGNFDIMLNIINATFLNRFKTLDIKEVKDGKTNTKKHNVDKSLSSV